MNERSRSEHVSVFSFPPNASRPEIIPPRPMRLCLTQDSSVHPDQRCPRLPTRVAAEVEAATACLTYQTILLLRARRPKDNQRANSPARVSADAHISRNALRL